jgi:hypothetical protein
VYTPGSTASTSGTAWIRSLKPSSITLKSRSYAFACETRISLLRPIAVL